MQWARMENWFVFFCLHLKAFIVLEIIAKICHKFESHLSGSHASKNIRFFSHLTIHHVSQWCNFTWPHYEHVLHIVLVFIEKISSEQEVRGSSLFHFLHNFVQMITKIKKKKKEKGKSFWENHFSLCQFQQEKILETNSNACI